MLLCLELQRHWHTWYFYEILNKYADIIEKVKIWSLEETESSYDQTFVCSVIPQQIIWYKAKKLDRTKKL